VTPIVPLRPNAPFVLRVGYNDHKSVLDALTGREVDGARIPVDVLVLEAHWINRHRQLAEEAAAGRQLVIDCRVDLWTLGDGAPALPDGRRRAYAVEEIDREARRIVRDTLAAQEHTIRTLAPACHVENLASPAWRTTLRLLDETIHQAGRVLSARIVGTPSALATEEGAAGLTAALVERGIDQVMLTVGPIREDGDGSNVLRLVGSLSRAGIRVHLTHQGALGLAALAMGAESFDAGLLGQGESFDYEAQRQQLLNRRPRYPRAPRSYVAPLLTSLPRQMAMSLLSLKAVRAALECDGPCCATHIDGAVLHPVTHFMFQRSAQVRAVLDMPVELRRIEVEKLYSQAETIYQAIRGVRRSDKSVLEPGQLEALGSGVRHVRAAGQQLRQAADSSQWAAL
jgi:hypothetical protein